MKRISLLAILALSMVLCLSISACGIVTVSSSIEKYGEVKSVGVTFEIFSSYAGVFNEQSDIVKIAEYFDNMQFNTLKEQYEEVLEDKTNVGASVLFETSSAEDSFSVTVFKDGTAYLSTKDGMYKSKDFVDAAKLKSFLFGL